LLLPFCLHGEGLLPGIGDCRGREGIEGFDAAVLLLRALCGDDLEWLFVVYFFMGVLLAGVFL